MTLSPIRSPCLDAAITNAYAVFSRYSLRGRLIICRCAVCVGEDAERGLTKTPLEDIAAPLLAEYSDSAHEWDGAVAEQFRYYLPRYFDLIAHGETPSGIGPEMCLGRLSNCDYRKEWSERESRAIDEFFAALVADRAAAPVRIAPDGRPPLFGDEVEAALCMAANAGVAMAPLLAAWEAAPMQAGALHVATMVADADWLKGRLANSFWGGPGANPPAEPAMREVLAWLLRYETRAWLERACLAERDACSAELLSFAEGVVGGMVGRKAE